MSSPSSEVSTNKSLEIIKSNFLCVFSILLFATGFPAAEYLLKDWDVVSIIAARNVFAFILIFFIWVVIEGLREVRAAKWIKGFGLAQLGKSC